MHVQNKTAPLFSPTEAALPPAPAFHGQRQLKPLPGEPEPRFLVERANRLGCPFSAFLSLLAETGCFFIGHGDTDNAQKQKGPPKNQKGPLTLRLDGKRPAPNFDSPISGLIEYFLGLDREAQGYFG
jgi:hypothetical protein